MKTVFLFLVVFVAIVSFGCDGTNDYEIEKERKGDITETTFFNFKDTISLGQSISDSIAILYYDTCNERSYFKSIQISDFEYNFELWDVRTQEGTCMLPLIRSKAPFSFTPTKKGRYTLRLIDIRDTITKTIVVN